jgi:hypothetical protein
LKKPENKKYTEVKMEQKDMLGSLERIVIKFLRLAEETESTSKARSALKTVEQALDIGGKVVKANTRGLNEQLLRELILDLTGHRVTRAEMWRAWLSRGGIGIQKQEFFRRLQQSGIHFTVHEGTVIASPPKVVRQLGYWPDDLRRKYKLDVAERISEDLA